MTDKAITIHVFGSEAILVPHDPAMRSEAKRDLSPLSYRVEGAEFSDAFSAGHWDGIKHMARLMKGGKIRLPAGLTLAGARLLKNSGWSLDFVDRRMKPIRRKLAYDYHEPRDYQYIAAKAAALKKRGTLVMSIRSGKTLTAAYIASLVGERTLFLTPSNLLLDQTLSVFRAAFPRSNVTSFGGKRGDDLTGDVVVGSIQSLAAKEGTRAFEAIRSGFSLVFIDEVHHLVGVGDVWRRVAEKLEAPRKIGLSGSMDECDAATQMLSEGICGPVLHRVTMNEMFDRGFLVSPEVRFVRYSGAEASREKWKAGTYNRVIVECEPRNEAIAIAASEESAAGRSVLIDTARVGHARKLAQLCRRRGVRTARVVTGTSSDEERLAAIESLSSGGVVIGTLLGEGIDIPALDVVINAEGGRRSASAIQRLRNLTPPSDGGQKQAIVYEMNDQHHEVLSRHTAERIAMYEALRGERKGPTIKMVG